MLTSLPALPLLENAAEAVLYATSRCASASVTTCPSQVETESLRLHTCVLLYSSA